MKLKDSIFFVFRERDETEGHGLLCFTEREMKLKDTVFVFTEREREETEGHGVLCF